MNGHLPLWKYFIYHDFDILLILSLQSIIKTASFLAEMKYLKLQIIRGEGKYIIESLLQEKF